MKRILICLAIAVISLSLFAQEGRRMGQDIDFSYCGYQYSEQAVPTLPVKAVVPVHKGDMSADIQAAIDYVSALPADENGWRGAVLLEKGEYRLDKSLSILASGVVLRGSGMDDAQTGTLLKSEQEIALVCIGKEETAATFGAFKDVQGKLPVGTSQIEVLKHGCKVGDEICIRQKALLVPVTDGRPGSKGTRVESPVVWRRWVTAVQGNMLTLDAPLTFSLPQDGRSAEMCRVTKSVYMEETGVENLCMESAGKAITVCQLHNGWIRRVQFDTDDNGIELAASVSNMTVEDCLSQNRSKTAFLLAGSRCLLQRLQVRHGQQSFRVAQGTEGPNAWVQCWSIDPVSWSGLEGPVLEAGHPTTGCNLDLSSGVLFDICSVHRQALRLDNPNPANPFESCCGTNCTFWNSQAAILSCTKPDWDNNYAYGAWGQFNGRGYWNGANNHSSPWSLFYSQLQHRASRMEGAAAAEACQFNARTNSSRLITLSGGGTSTVEDARYQTERSRKGETMISERIAQITVSDPIDTSFEESMKTIWK